MLYTTTSLIASLLRQHHYTTQNFTQNTEQKDKQTRHTPHNATSQQSKTLLRPLLEHQRLPTLTTAIPIIVNSHKRGRTTRRIGALTSQSSDLVVLYLVVLEDGELYLLVLVLLDFGLGEVLLLLLLLAATTQTEDEVECGLLLDVVVGEGAAVLQLLAGEDQTLLVRWDA